MDEREELAERIEALRQQMFAAAENLEFETAARLRDDLRRLQSGLTVEEREAMTPAPPRASSKSMPPGRGKARASYPPAKRRR